MALVIAAKLKFDPGVKRKLAKLNPTATPRVFEKAAMEVALRIQTLAQKKYILSGNGPVHAKYLTHRTGNLRDSIRVDRSGLPRKIEVGTEVLYGAYHETGKGVKKARPFMAPALKEVQPKIPAIFVKHWKREAGL